jgi:predicted nucleotidyltransferase
MSKPVIEALFGRGTKARVIEWLYVQQAKDRTVNARNLARKADVPYGSIDKTLKELVAAQLVVRQESEHGPEYRAPEEDSRLAGLFLLLRQDSELVERLKRALSRFKAIEYACVFGSFAKGTTRRGSDVDVLVLEQEGLDRFAVMVSLTKVAERTKREVNPDFYSVDEFRHKIEAGDPFSREVVGGSRIDLKGTPPWLR